VKVTPYVNLQTSGDAGTAHGRKYYIKGGFVQKASPGLIDIAHRDHQRGEAAGRTGRRVPAGRGRMRG
jgi:hypothetical protein